MAEYPKFINDEENKEIEAIDAALGRLKAREKEYLAKKRRIMNRAIRRKRRAEGKS